MKTLVAATAGEDVNSVATSVARAGMEPVRVHWLRLKVIKPVDVAAIVVVGLPRPRPWFSIIEENIPMGLLLRMSDLMSPEREIDRFRLRLWSQRADQFFVETEPCANRLVGILGLLGRLNRFTMGTSLVQIWQPDVQDDRMSRWLENPDRSPDAEENWPRLGGDALLELKSMRPWFDPRRWLSG